VLAAIRAGIREVVLPDKNRNDLDEVPQEVLSRLRFHYVESVDQVLLLALDRVPRARLAGRLVAPVVRPRARERRVAARS
jgi:ATP-dependent Lon protease